MKFSAILAFALTAYTTLASAQSFRKDNADKAEQLAKDFAKLTPDSPCTAGQQACVQKQFAQCVNGKFALTACSGGLQCEVLPLVNSPGTSITCSTEADRKARLADARNSADNGNKQPDTGVKQPDTGVKQPDNGNNATQPDNGNKQPDTGVKQPDNGVKQPGNGKKGDGKKGKKNGKNGKNGKKQPDVGQQPDNGKKQPDNGNQQPDNGKKQPDVGQQPDNGNNTTQPDNGKKQPDNGNQQPDNGNNGKKPVDSKKPTNSNDVQQPPSDVKQPSKSPSNNIADIRKKNADEADALQQKFNTLNENSKCTDGENACVKDQFAQCSNGKFALTACANGLKCAALPLVLKPGTSVTCTTEADRVARLDQARKNLK